MKKIFLMLLIFLSTLSLKSIDTVKQLPLTNWIDEVVVRPRKVVDDRIIEALIHVESRGNDNALGDKAKDGHFRAVGALQIHKVYVNAVNNLLKAEERDYRFTYNDRYNRKKSILMTKIYLSHFCEKHNRYDAAAIAMMHNGGGHSGLNNPKTLKYAKKVMRYLDEHNSENISYAETDNRRFHQ